MSDLISKTFDFSLRKYELNWIEATSKNARLRDIYRNPTLSLYTSMVYGFSNHLPYSMDIEQEEYVPADFLNMIPNDGEENSWFKWEDRITFFNSMVNWGDTFKSAILLQICNIFQKMILGQFPNDYVLTEENYTTWGIDKMTDNREYNRCFFEILKSLPSWYSRLISSSDNQERRSILESLYASMTNRISAYYGSLKETGIDGNVVRENKGSTPIRPSDDVAMLVHWENITFHDGISDIIEAIKKEQLENYNKTKSPSLSELPDGSQVHKLK